MWINEKLQRNGFTEEWWEYRWQIKKRKEETLRDANAQRELVSEPTKETKLVP